jgi:uncharacterized membrane protein
MTDPTINGDREVNDESKVERVQDPESIDEADRDFEQFLKPEALGEITQRISSIQSALVSYSGPLPPASEVAKYEEVYPGAAERIISLAENVQKLQEKALDKHHARSTLTTVTSALVSLSVVGVAALAVLFDPAWLSIPLVGTGILGLLLREWLRRTRDRKE